MVGALIIFSMPKNRSELFQPLAIFLSIIPFSICLYLFSNDNSKSSYQEFESINWISSYGIKISLHFAVNGVFLSGDLLSLFIFFEAILIPMYFLMGIWGGENRRYATIKFIIYTVFGSIFIFIGTVYAGVISYSQTGILALDFVTLSNISFTSEQSKALFLLFTFGFLVYTIFYRGIY